MGFGDDTILHAARCSICGQSAGSGTLGRRCWGSPRWCGWSTFAVVCGAEGPLNVGVLSFTIAV
jgi:hypothetical protein